MFYLSAALGGYFTFYSIATSQDLLMDCYDPGKWYVMGMYIGMSPLWRDRRRILESYLLCRMLLAVSKAHSVRLGTWVVFVHLEAL